jgi:predicted permease
MSRLIAARYRAEVVADLADERDQMRRAGRSSAYGAIWMAAHMSRSAVASRRRERRAFVESGTGRPPRWPGSGAAREIRHALRSLRRAPWYAGTVIVVTALSMALASTVFAVVDGVLFKPLPYPDPEELYAVSGRFDDGYTSERGVEVISPLEVAAWSAVASDVRLTSLLYSSFSFDDGTRVGGVNAGPGFFEVFGVRLLAGGFTDEHYATELPVRPIVISHRLWQTRFDGDPGTLGRILPPGDDYSPPHQIVGILARDVVVPPLPRAGAAARLRNRIDVIRPPSRSPSGQLSSERSSLAFARITRAALPAAQAALDRAAEAYRATASPMPEGLPAAARRFWQPYDHVELLPLRDLVSSRERPVLALAFGMAMSLVVLVLLNVGALAMARAQQRIRDLSLRRALGARTRDLLRHALMEQAVLFGGGAAAGLLASPMLLAFVLDRLPPGLNLIKEVRLDWRVLAFAAIVSAAAALAVALLSVRVAVRHASVTPALADAHGSAPGRLRIGRVLIAGQTAVAFALVLGGALFATSLVRIWSEDPGLRLGHAATFNVDYRNREGTTIDRWRRTNDLAGALRTTPGVRGIALLDERLMESLAVEPSLFHAPPSAIEDAPMPASIRVSSTFFETAGIQLVEGRLPSDVELDAGAPVVAVSETVARAYWPEGTAIGQTLRADRPSSPVECVVVGVVRDVRLQALDLPSTGVIFASWALPIRQSGATVLVAMDDDAVLSTVLRRLGELEPAATPRNVRLLEEAAAETIRERRLAAAMGSTFGGVALVFVALGVLGLVAMTSSRRTREMAIRLALGAEPGGVTRLLVGEQLRAVGLGLVAGGVLAAWFVPLLGSRLYGIGVYDASTWTLTVAVIAATATIGALVPAWRASRIDPAAVLRGE